ncbi:hypothetical protein [Campylobacter lanienae]|uniref:hypothetical protein n=1 Tax=Campylobacter lanienae TaxID=75658 RepID=UPI000BB3FF5A|nr:hypothetical protein [Campylobacter lanienae]
MKILFYIFSLVLIGYCKCELIQKSNTDINSASLNSAQISYSDSKNLYTLNLATNKITTNIQLKSDKINTIKLNNENLIAGLDSGYLIQISPKGDKEILIDPIKTGIIDSITSINFIKDKIILTIGSNHLIIYDEINKIYKISNLNLKSKITTTHIINDNLYISTFDRNIYNINLRNLTTDKISTTPSIPTAIHSVNNEIIIGLINGELIYKNQIYKVSNNQISAIKIYKNNIYIADWSSNLYIYDFNLNLKNSIKIGNDAIMDMFINTNSQIILWNRAIYSCGIE